MVILTALAIFPLFVAWFPFWIKAIQGEMNPFKIIIKIFLLWGVKWWEYICRRFIGAWNDRAGCSLVTFTDIICSWNWWSTLRLCCLQLFLSFSSVIENTYIYRFLGRFENNLLRKFFRKTLRQCHNEMSDFTAFTWNKGGGLKLWKKRTL